MSKKKLRVIITDDEAHIRLYIKTVLNSMNVEVVGEAKNGNEAVELFRKELPNMMLMDINMPIKNGIDALREIMAEFPDALIIMLTSFSDHKTVQECIDIGACNYIRKDTPIPEMKRIIKETWDEYRKEKGGIDV